MNKKDLVNYIKKIAQTPGDVGAFPGAEIANKPGATTTNKPVVTEDPNIKSMQEALVGLSRSFTSQRTDLKPPTGQPTRKSFADFVSTNLKDPNTGASPVLDSLKQLSDPKTGGFPIDGKWGPKTYAALHRATEFAQSLFKIANERKINVTSYSEDNLNILMQFIKGDKLTQKQKVDNAAEITKHINSIADLYSEVMKTIMASPAMREQIEGMPAEKDSLPPQVLSALNSKYNRFMITHQSDAGVIQKPISVNDFASKEALMAWREKNMPGTNTPLSNIVTQLKQQVEKMQ